MFLGPLGHSDQSPQILRLSFSLLVAILDSFILGYMVLFVIHRLPVIS